jgi:outer membrane immunogenic protein
MRMSALICAALALIVTTPAFAEGPYVGGNYTQLKYTDEDDQQPNADAEIEPTAAYLRLGVEPNEVIGVEARGGIGLQADERDGVEFETDHFYGGYITLGAPIGDALRPYVMGGYTKTQSTVKADTLLGTYKDTTTREDESWGVGMDLNLTGTTALNLEYMRYLDKENLELSGVSLGIRSAF